MPSLNSVKGFNLDPDDGVSVTLDGARPLAAICHDRWVEVYFTRLRPYSLHAPRRAHERALHHGNGGSCSWSSRSWTVTVAPWESRSVPSEEGILKAAVEYYVALLWCHLRRGCRQLRCGLRESWVFMVETTEKTWEVHEKWSQLPCRSW